MFSKLFEIGCEFLAPKNGPKNPIFMSLCDEAVIHPAGYARTMRTTLAATLQAHMSLS